MRFRKDNGSGQAGAAGFPLAEAPAAVLQGSRGIPSKVAPMFIATFTGLMLFNVSVAGVIVYKLYTHLRDRSRRQPPQA